MADQPIPISILKDPVTAGYGGDYQSSNYIYDSYAGVDIIAQIIVPGEDGPLTLGELQTISYSIHRENTPARVLGHVSPRGFGKGPRTIAGSLIFIQFNTYAFYRLKQYWQLVYAGSSNASMYPLADMLPPFDIVLTFSNEYGRYSKMKLYGVTIIDEGGTMSVDDLVTEQTYTFMARGIQPLNAYIPDNQSAVPVKYAEASQSPKNVISLPPTI